MIHGRACKCDYDPTQDYYTANNNSCTRAELIPIELEQTLLQNSLHRYRAGTRTELLLQLIELIQNFT